MTTTEKPQAITFATLPTLRAALDNGTFIGIATLDDGRHVAVAHLANATEELDHVGAMAWAAEQGGTLISPALFHLLLANAPDLVPRGWTWTNKRHGSSFAWCCNHYGGQGYGVRSALGGAVAVSLIPLTL